MKYENLNHEKLNEIPKENLAYSIMSLFVQSCSIDNRESKYKYSHGWLGAYENAQSFLIDVGLIKEEECEIP